MHTVDISTLRMCRFTLLLSFSRASTIAAEKLQPGSQLPSSLFTHEVKGIEYKYYTTYQILYYVSDTIHYVSLFTACSKCSEINSAQLITTQLFPPNDTI